MMALKELGETTEDFWRPLWDLPDHSTERLRTARSEWDMFQMDVIEFLRSRCFMKNRVTEEELHKMVGIFLVNGVTIGNPKSVSYGKALFPIFSNINHDCLSNAKFKIDQTTWAITVKAQCDIDKGEEITVQYLTSILGSHKRRKRIRAEWYFDCQCSRCQDPTEMDTMISALVCEVCEQDYLLPTEPLNMMSDWVCGSCDFFLKASDAEAKVDHIEEELSEVSGKRNLKALEDFVQHYTGRVLHPNHYLLLLAKRNYLFISRKNLIELMAKCSVQEQNELRSAFRNKSELYKEFWWIPEKLRCADAF